MWIGGVVATLIERSPTDFRTMEYGGVAVAPRAYWKGYLKLSLVSCPIALYPATSEREKISFHQLNKKTGNRIRYRKVDAETGDEVETDDIVKGYEVGKGEYIELEPEELEAVAIESKRTIEIDEFVPRTRSTISICAIPITSCRMARSASRPSPSSARRSARRAWWRSAKVVFTSREHVIALEARDKGMMGVTLRYPYEVRKEEDYFDDIADEKVPKDMLDLAMHIVETKTAHFEPEKFEDQYEDALKDLLKKKQKGRRSSAAERAPSNVVNLMDALRRSVKAGRGGARRRSSERTRPSGCQEVRPLGGAGIARRARAG